jgi:hypothetical protein
MTDYASQVCFLPLYEGSDEKRRLGGEESYWPGVLFTDKEEFASQQADLLDIIGHNQEIQRTTTNDLLVFRDAPPERSKFAYLLGGKKFPPNVSRLRWTTFPASSESSSASSSSSTTSQFEDGYFQAMETSSGIPGFRDALKEALLLVYGPEFSRTRLRFGELPSEELEQAVGGSGGGGNSKQLWPCLLFDDYLQLTAGLRERNLLSSHEEVELSRMFVPLSQSEETRNPPYVYFFGREHVGHCIDAFDDTLQDFKTNLFDTMMNNMSKKPFMSALFEAMNVVSGAGGKKYFPFIVDHGQLQHQQQNQQADGEDVPRGNDTSMVADMPVTKGTLRVDFGQKECIRCNNGTGSHAKTCAFAPDNWYIPPKPALLAMLTETQYKSLHEVTKKRIKSLGLEKHLCFTIGASSGKRKTSSTTNPTPLRHSKRTSVAPNEVKSS